MKIVIMGKPAEGKTTIAQRIAEVLKIDGYNIRVEFKDEALDKADADEWPEVLLGRRKAVRESGTEIIVETLTVRPELKAQPRGIDDGSMSFPEPRKPLEEIISEMSEEVQETFRKTFNLPGAEAVRCTCIQNGGNAGCPEHDPRKRAEAK